MFFGSPVWTIQFNPPFDEPIKKIAKLGFKGVELVGWDRDSLKEYYTSQTISHLKALISDLGLTLTNFNHSPKYLCSEDTAEREAAEDGYRYAIETAQALGSKFITSVAPYPFSAYNAVKQLKMITHSEIWTVETDMNRDWDANYQLYASQITKCCELAKQAGLKVLIEPHPYRWVNSASSMKLLQQYVKADNLGFNLDPSHLFSSGDMPQCTVYQLKDCLSHVHFSDNDTYTNAHWRPGKGKIDWHAVMKALKDIGYQGVLSMELEDVPGAASKESPFSTDAIDQEMKLAMKYIREVAIEAGAEIE
jgi:sugar phosphate isomerase/epimerase